MVPFVRLWIWISAFASLAGWGLSAAGQLNRGGYTVCVGVAAIIFLFLRWRKHSTFNIQHRTSNEAARNKNFGRRMLNVECSTFPMKLVRRFRRPLPLCFGALAVLIFLGGAIYPPGNYTGLTYRVARVLQWLEHGGWFWIHTANYRMNDRACGIEWIYAPLLLFTKSDRGLFLVNFLPFLLMPGLVFSVFTRLGVRARVAWQWMWLLPTGYNFLLQAGSIANDTFPVVFALAALDFGLRAWTSRRASDLWHSILAAALLTGAKASNLPLLLPWAIVIFPLVPLLRRKLAATGLVILVAAAVSFLSIAVLNARHCGDWTGSNLEDPRLAMKNPVVGVWGNGFQLVLDNFSPPVFPMAHSWNENAPSLMPHSLTAAVNKYFDDGFFSLGELQTEDWAGIGFGLSILLAVSVFAARGIRAPPGTVSVAVIPSLLRRCVLAAAWVSLLAYCVKSGMTGAARLITPYYPLLVASLVAGAGQSEIVRRRWWRIFSGATLALAFVVLVLSPDRPLWPAKTILSRLSARHPDQPSLTRALKVYTTYAQRHDSLAGVRDLLPPGTGVVGFVAGPDDADISLWRPIGDRRVEHFLLSDPPELFLREQIKYAVVGGFNLKMRHATIEDWMQKSGAELVASTNATLKVSEGPQQWFVVRFK
jgi:hypothetical protein